jgi:hypothetical protein
MARRGPRDTGAYITVRADPPGLLDEISGRMIAPEFGLETIEAFEKEEATIFESYAGKYVKTGALKASLTESDASGAIRELLPGEFKFGTSIWYAVFQGTTGPGSKQPPSAVLKVSALEAAAAASDLTEYIMKGRQAGLLL